MEKCQFDGNKLSLLFYRIKNDAAMKGEKYDCMCLSVYSVEPYVTYPEGLNSQLLLLNLTQTKSVFTTIPILDSEIDFKQLMGFVDR